MTIRSKKQYQEALNKANWILWNKVKDGVLIKDLTKRELELIENIAKADKKYDPDERFSNSPKGNKK